MNIQAIMMMKDDIKRMEFVLYNFFKWNPEIPVLVYNCGGKSPKEEIKQFKNASLIDYDDIWHKRGPNGVGSFDPRWFQLMFEYGLNSDYTHTLFLETDVLTTYKITKEPKYDMSGVLNFCSQNEFVYYNMLKMNVQQHSGCGGTIYRTDFFNKCKDNLEIVNLLYCSRPQNFFQDLVMTILGRYSGCSYGHWEECSDIRGHWEPSENGQLKFTMPPSHQATLIHSLKV